MTDKYQAEQSMLADLLDDTDIKVSVQELKCVLTIGEVSVVVEPVVPVKPALTPVKLVAKPADSIWCLAVFHCPGWIYKTGLPISWKRHQLPEIYKFMDDWTAGDMDNYGSEYNATRNLMLIVNKYWNILMAMFNQMEQEDKSIG